VSVSGHVYDIATGRVTTTLEPRRPRRDAPPSGVSATASG